MDGIGEYLIGVVAAALLCGIVTTLIGNKGALGVSLKMMTGLLMLLAVLRPWTSISLNGLFGWVDDIKANGMDYATSGKLMAYDSYRTRIKENTEAYILDEAKALNCDLTVEVSLSQQEIPIPIKVRLAGEVSPYAKKVLTTMMTEKFGIKQEDQIWI